MKLSKTSIVLLVIQLALVSSIAAKYLYQRAHCPRVWVRTAAYDPEMVMRGRYLSRLPAPERWKHAQGTLYRESGVPRLLPRQAQGGRR